MTKNKKPDGRLWTEAWMELIDHRLICREIT